MLKLEEMSPIAIASGVILTGFLGLVTLISGCNSVVTINPGERGVSTTLGHLDNNVRQPGFQFKKPFIENVRAVSIQQITRSGKAAVYSSDLQPITIDYQVMFRLPENKLVTLERNYQGHPEDALLIPNLENTLKEVSSQFTAEEIVKKRDIVISQVRARIEDDLKDKDGKYLIIVNNIPLTNIDLSDELERAIEDKQVKQQQALAMKYTLEKAVKQSEITVVEAKAEAESTRIKGEAVAKNPKVIELELVKKWDGKAPSTVVSGSGGANLVLPLK